MMHKSSRVEAAMLATPEHWRRGVSRKYRSEQARDLAKDPHRKGPFTIYARVHVFPEKEAAALCVAVGTHITIANGKATYSW